MTSSMAARISEQGRNIYWRWSFSPVTTHAQPFLIQTVVITDTQFARSVSIDVNELRFAGGQGESVRSNTRLPELRSVEFLKTWP